MADWKDFYEDNKEFRGQYLDSLAERRRTTAQRIPPMPQIQFCPLCHTAYFDDAGIARHVQAVHGPQHVYLRVNGRIIRDVGWAEQGITDLRLVLLGFSDAAVEMNAGRFAKSLKIAGGEDLEGLIPSGLEGELTLRAEPNGGKARQFMLYSRSLPQFRQENLDALIQSLSSKFGAPDIARWRGLAGEMGPLENRYLNGFFEYTLAFHLEKNGHSNLAKQHFEDAFGLLLPFRTPLAHSAQCVLGLRMNCFGVLERAPRASIVAASDRFFNQPFPSEWVRETTADEGSPFMGYADEFTVRLVKVIADYYDDPARCAVGLEALEFHPSATTKNSEDKLSLLRARLLRRAGNSLQAKSFYESLRYHPLFGSESVEYLNG